MKYLQCWSEWIEKIDGTKIESSKTKGPENSKGRRLVMVINVRYQYITI